jgi:hypothetical protein
MENCSAAFHGLGEKSQKIFTIYYNNFKDEEYLDASKTLNSLVDVGNYFMVRLSTALPAI